MKKTFRLAAMLMALAIVVGSLLVPAFAANEGDEYTLAGIGTDALENWAFYYTTASKDSADPTANKIPLSKPARTGNVANGCWPFDDAGLTAYDNPDWASGSEQNIIYYKSAELIFA